MIDQVDVFEVSDREALPNNPLVSVQIIAYKHERFLADAIEGVIAQICDFSIELIIADDCSPDGTLAVALDYQQRNPSLIRVISAGRNVGGHANVARCHAFSRGLYVTQCDGDDYWHDRYKLQMQVDLMRSNPSMSFCHTDFDRQTRFTTSHSMHRAHPTQWLAQGDAYLSLLYEWSVMTATAMFKRDIVDTFLSTEFNNVNWPFGDRNLTLYASLRGPVGYIAKSTATYRKVKNSAMNSGAATYLRMPIAAEECINLFLKTHPVHGSDQRKIEARLKLNIYRSAFFAERIDLMQSTYEWLQMNGFEQPHLLHSARIAAVKLKFPVRALRAVKNFIDLRLSSIPS